jgi:Flp pilus assembly pilin Flp
MARSMKLLMVLAAGLARNCHGQDMIEYALMAAAVSIVVAGFLPVQVLPVISGVFSRILSVTGMMP